MLIKLSICFLVVACVCQQVTSQLVFAKEENPSRNDSSLNSNQSLSDQNSTSQSPLNQSSSSTSSQSSTALGGNVTQASNFGNASAANVSSLDFTNQAPITQFFGLVMNDQVFGLKKCKKPKDCPFGRCDILLNLCVPLNTPILSDIEKVCTNQSECSRMHSCQSGLCKFCGPKSCRSNLDCCAGSFAEPGKPGRFYECLDIKENEKLSLAKQLGRVPANFQPVPKAKGGKSLDDAFEVESSELIQLGIQPAVGKVKNPLHGKRCWARCNVDNDCYSERTPADIKQKIACCDGACVPRSSCLVLSPQVLQMAQQLQQQRLQQQQVFAQQQALLGQQPQQQQPQQQVSQWGAAGHGQQYVAPPSAVQQPQQHQYVVFAAQPQQPPVPATTPKPVPLSWQQAQQAPPPAPQWQQQRF